MTKFPALNEQTDFPYFRTLHSLAYRCLGVSTKDMMTPQNYREFAQEAGIELAIEVGEEEYAVRADHPVLNEINLARIRGEDLRTYYNHSAMTIEWYHFEYVERCYRHYKQANNLVDFTDLLERLLLEPHRLPSLETVIIDEAQDLSRLQWDLVQQLAARCNQVYVAGDDDQACFNWAGADVQSFLSLAGNIKVLEQSYRIPLKVYQLADSVVRRIRVRQEKVWRPREAQGAVHYYNHFEQVDVTTGQWLILATTNYMLNDMYAWLKSQGLLFERNGQKSISEAILLAVLGWEALRKGKEVPFLVVKQIYKYLGSSCVARGYKTLLGADVEKPFNLLTLQKNHGLMTEDIWHVALSKIGEDKRDYLIALLRRGTRVTGKVNIKLSTIHGAKGGEADNVLLLTDLSPKFAKDYDRNSDDINRLFYVGLTRARESLHLVLPKNEQKGFRL